MCLALQTEIEHDLLYYSELITLLHVVLHTLPPQVGPSENLENQEIERESLNKIFRLSDLNKRLNCQLDENFPVKRSSMHSVQLTAKRPAY